MFASCRKAEDCDRLKGEGFESPRIDYDDSDSIHSGLAEVTAATGGTLDAVFNNGAYACPGAVEDLPREALKANFETNVFGVHELTRAVIPIMRQQGYGRIINCSSVLGFVGGPWRGSYVATKFALEGLTDVLRIEMANLPIHVILIEPGPITSEFRNNTIPHFRKWIDHENSARADEYTKLIDGHLNSTGPTRFELPAEAVTKKLIHALESPRPKPRYYVTVPTYIVGFLKRILSTRALDRFLNRG